MPRTLDRRIDEIDGHTGEWFVYLKPGYAVLDASTPRAQHCFGEDTKADIRRRMRLVVPCECDECIRLGATRLTG